MLRGHPFTMCGFMTRLKPCCLVVHQMTRLLFFFGRIKERPAEVFNAPVCLLPLSQMVHPATLPAVPQGPPPGAPQPCSRYRTPSHAPQAVCKQLLSPNNRSSMTDCYRPVIIQSGLWGSHRSPRTHTRPPRRCSGRARCWSGEESPMQAPAWG